MLHISQIIDSILYADLVATVSYWSVIRMFTNCVNCGAVLHGHKCEYCGTEYLDRKIVADMSDAGMYGQLKIGGNTYEVYLSKMEGEPICSGPYRDEKGKLHVENMTTKHKFTFVEV